MLGRRYLVLLVAGAMSVLAASGPSMAKPPNGWDPLALGLRLQDPSMDERTQALVKIHEWFSVDPVDGAKELRGVWGQRLFETRQYSELTDLTQQAILAVPGETPVVEDLLQLRVKAFLASGQPQKALQTAKSLFNLVRPQKTPSAILLLAQCMEKAHPEDSAIYATFQAQQIAGANQSSKNIRCALLDAVVIDATPYQALLDQYKKKELSDNREIVALGNLQLMANESAKAEETFGLLDPTNQKLFAESIARTYKAEDGTIARANRYLLELDEP